MICYEKKHYLNSFDFFLQVKFKLSEILSQSSMENSFSSDGLCKYSRTYLTKFLKI